MFIIVLSPLKRIYLPKNKTQNHKNGPKTSETAPVPLISLEIQKLPLVAVSNFAEMIAKASLFSFFDLLFTSLP